MTKGELNSHLVPFPPVDEQTAIASFLDHETSNIDTLIAEQRNLIDLLKEKRQAVISHAVTKGLNPDAPIKDSGVEWLGEVPEHWQTGPLKRFAEVIDCKHVTVEFLAEGWPVVSIRELRDDWIDLTSAKQTSRAEWDFLRENRTPTAGDLIFSRNASVGAVGYVEPGVDFCMGQDVCLIRPKIRRKYLYFQLWALHLTGASPWPVCWITFQGGRMTACSRRRGWRPPGALGCNDVAVAHRVVSDGEFEHPVENHPAATGAATVEAEHELIQVAR
jgi:hypothetical protein